MKVNNKRMLSDKELLMLQAEGKIELYFTDCGQWITIKQPLVPGSKSYNIQSVEAGYLGDKVLHVETDKKVVNDLDIPYMSFLYKDND